MVIKMQNIGVGNEYGESRAAERNGKEDKGTAVKNGAVFGGNIKQKLDPVAAKKAQAQKNAMKLWDDAVGAEKKIDDDIREKLKNIDNLRTENAALNEEVKKYAGLQEDLKEKYNLSDEEQADFHLLNKSRKEMKGKRVSFTEEERERLKELLSRPLEGRLKEFSERYNELEGAKAIYQEEIAENLKTIREDSNYVRGIINGRLKSHAMIDAQKEKDESMRKASEEAVHMMMGEVKDHIDEQQEEIEEKAEEKAEKEEEKQDQIDAVKDKSEEGEGEEVEVGMTEQIINLNSTKSDIQQEVDKMVNDMKLLAEDLKGAKVNEVV